MNNESGLNNKTEKVWHLFFLSLYFNTAVNNAFACCHHVNLNGFLYMLCMVLALYYMIRMYFCVFFIILLLIIAT